jgi:ribosomal protein S18 acetylase RimI-like enzyme
VGDVSIVPLTTAHLPALAEILRATPEFTTAEVTVALEVLDEAIRDNGFTGIVAERDEAVLGYACFGATPMTESTFDLYWIAVSPAQKRSGVGRALTHAVLRAVRAKNARVLRVETEGGERYAATRAFYTGLDFEIGGEIRDFYAPGRGLVVFVRYL